MKFLRLVIFMLLISASSASYAQDRVVSAQLSLSNPTPLVGEPVEMTLTVTAPREVEITQWPDFDREWETLSVLETGDIQIDEAGDTLTYTQVYRVVFWYPGDFSTPDIFVGYDLPGGDETQQTEVTPAFLSIPSVLEGANLVLRPLKPQIWLPYLSPLLIAAVVVGAGGLAFAGYRWRQVRKAQRGALDFDEALPDAGSPAHVALGELKRIYNQKLAPELVYAQVADCLRVYIHAQFQVSTLDLTSDELIHAIRQSALPLPDDLQNELRRMLQQADLAKFARYRPNERNAKGYVNAAGKWIQSTDELNQPQPSTTKDSLG